MNKLKKLVIGLMAFILILQTSGPMIYGASEISSELVIDLETASEETDSEVISEEIDSEVISEEIDSEVISEEIDSEVISEETDSEVISEETDSEVISEEIEPEVKEEDSVSAENSDDANVKSGEVVNKTYYPNGQLKTIEYRNSNGIRTDYKTYDSDGNKTSDYSYYSDGCVHKKITYYTNGKYKVYEVRDHGVRSDYKTYDSDGNKTSDYSYYDNGNVDKKITYYTNGKYKVYEKRNNGKRTDYKTYNSKGVKTSDYSYFSNGNFKERIKYDSKGYKTEQIERNKDLTMKYKWLFYDGNNRVRLKFYYKNDKRIKAYTYFNTKGHERKYRYEYYSNQEVYRRYEYDKNDVRLSTEEYASNGNHTKHWDYYKGGNTKYRYINHYHNGVKTGTTKKWYYSDGSTKKIDATTYPTYYSQYTQSYKKYSCPAYNGDMYKHGCIMNAMAMYYSIYNNDELTPIELYNQGYHCFFDVERAYAKNGLNVKEVQVNGNSRSAFTTFKNRSNAIPNGKSTFTISEAIVDYGMPVQLMMRSNGHISTNFPGHSVLAYRYVYENGQGKIYAKDPGAKGPSVNLQKYMDGKYHEYGANWYKIQNAWVGA